MKRILLLTFTAVLTLAAMTGCTRKNDNGQSAVEDAITTISDGLDDMMGDETSEHRESTGHTNTSQSTEGSESGDHSRARRTIPRH